jgi:hypothetical protein
MLVYIALKAYVINSATEAFYTHICCIFSASYQLQIYVRYISEVLYNVQNE